MPDGFPAVPAGTLNYHTGYESMFSDSSVHIAKIEQATLAAGRYLLNQVKNPDAIEMWHKKDNTLVMTLDIESQRIITESLGREMAIVGEEDEDSHKLLATAQDYYLIDPVDGTASCKRFLGKEAGQLGFGPLVGIVKGGRLQAATFYHVPYRTLYTALRGRGAFMLQVDPSASIPENLPDLRERRRLKVADDCSLAEAGVLFFPGVNGECRIIEYLKGNSLVENVYRFGGFANDCVRLALGYEQIQVQFSVKSWDFSASLIAAEAGMKVIVDPKGSKTDLYDWVVQPENPVIACLPSLVDEMLDIARKTA